MMKLILDIQVDTCHFGVAQPDMPNTQSKFAYLETWDEVDFLHVLKHESFLQIDTMIIDGDDEGFPKFSKFAIFLQYLKKEVNHKAF